MYTMEYVRLYDTGVNSTQRNNVVILEFLIVMINKVKKSTISSRQFKDEIIDFCSKFDNKDYVFLINTKLLDTIYTSHSFKRNIKNIINLYLNNFITFNDVKNGIKIRDEKIDKQKNNYTKLIAYDKTNLENIQNMIITNNLSIEKDLSNCGFIIEGEKDILFINNIINAYNSGLLTLSEYNCIELNKLYKTALI